ncbi:NAD-dependent epimerase/dehydratase family protein [Paenibacillus plantarum]|uniref:NAD-dependent epimerase/dehydratase family protein n=1 Tax=Paenibacillus plantarum TaxID=2654975 RepID=UPI0014928063|nr:NAD-dependent epimerase/dehydratase family protein [Paenibacillus plantarum]
MRILVTGATGFVGSCLARRLIVDGYDVHIFTRSSSDKWRIRDLLTHVTEHDVDLRDPDRIRERVSAIRPEVIFHAAVYGGFSFQNDAASIYAMNVQGTIQLLSACERAGFAAFINLGSSSEYGMKSAPMRETDLLEPIGDYAVSKAAATLYCRTRAVEQQFPVVTLRLFSPYGPWDDPKRYIPYVIRSMLSRQRPQVSVPTSVRDYIYIDDAVEACVRAMQGTPCTGEIINVGSGSQVSIGEVAGMLTEIIGMEFEPQWGKNVRKKIEPTIWSADIGKSKQLWGWDPIVTLREGLIRTVEWNKEHMRGDTGN